MEKNNGGKGGGASKGGVRGGADRGERQSIEEEILAEADADGGDADGAEDDVDEEDDADEPESADGSGDDDGAEGDENDGDSGEDAGEGEEEEDGEESGEDVDADGDEDGDDDQGDIRSLFIAQNKQFQTLVKALEDRAEGDKSSKGMTDDQWAQVEEQTGMKKAAFTFVTERIFKPALQQLAKNFGTQLAELKSASVYDRLAKDPKFKGVQAYRPRMEKILSQFAPEVRTNPSILRMAYLAAKGMGAKKAVQDEGNRREMRKKITMKSRPGAGGAGDGGGKDGKGKIRLSPVQRQAAKLGGMSDAEYIREMRPRKK